MRAKSVELDAYQKTDMHEIRPFAVQGYTSCNLTKSGDKLMAIASMANRSKEVFEECYFAGLWEHNFVEQLGWRVKTFQCINFDREYTMKIPRDWIHVMLEKPETVTGTIHFASLTAETELHKLVFSATPKPQQIDEGWWWAYEDGRERQACCQFFLDQPRSEDPVSSGIPTDQ